MSEYGSPAEGQPGSSFTDVCVVKIPGEPQGKARAKVYRNKYTGNSQAITPEKTELYENLIRMLYMEAAKEYGVQRIPRDHAVYMYIVTVYGIPKSATKRNRAAMEKGDMRPLKKPDLDNVIKVVADALNGLAYEDDSQIVDIQAAKRYTRGEETPHVWVKVWGVQPESSMTTISCR